MFGVKAMSTQEETSNTGFDEDSYLKETAVNALVNNFGFSAGAGSLYTVSEETLVNIFMYAMRSGLEGIPDYVYEDNSDSGTS